MPLSLQIHGVRDSIRFRWSEWVASAVQVLWGYTVVVHDALDNPAWLALSRLASYVGLDRHAWGWLAAALGVARIAVLLRNGRWHRGPATRTWLAIGSGAFWAALVYALWIQNGINTGTASYMGWMAADFGIIFIASFDERRFAQARKNGRV